MKSSIGWIAIAMVVAATMLLLTMSARAHEPTETVEATAPEEPAVDEEAGRVLFSAGGTIGGEDPAPPSLSAQQVHDGLVAISPGGGWQLPAPTAVDTSAWQVAQAGLATMRVPPDWVVQTRIGEPGGEDQTIGLSPPSNELYVELRVIRNADSNYLSTIAEHASSEYARSPGRLAQGLTLGYQPRMQGLAAGHVEVMNQFGKDLDEDGNRTFRLVLWRGRWEADGEFHRVEFTGTMAQDQYAALAPLVSAILGTVEIRASEDIAVE
jgi:hypothetical protein